MQDAQKRMQKAEKEYRVLKKDNEKLREMLAFLQCLPERTAPLTEYYFKEWLEDLEVLSKTDFDNEAMGQDAIYEEITVQYETMKKILLVCAKFINSN